MMEQNTDLYNNFKVVDYVSSTDSVDNQILWTGGFHYNKQMTVKQWNTVTKQEKHKNAKRSSTRSSGENAAADLQIPSPRWSINREIVTEGATYHNDCWQQRGTAGLCMTWTGCPGQRASIEEKRFTDGACGQASLVLLSSPPSQLSLNPSLKLPPSPLPSLFLLTPRPTLLPYPAYR